MFPDAVDGFDSAPDVLAKPENCKECRLYRLTKKIKEKAAAIPGTRGYCVRAGGVCSLPARKARKKNKLRLAAVRERKNR